MPRNHRVLAVDLGARHFGWACDRSLRAAHGLIDMPGILDPGQLWASVEDEVEKLIQQFEPQEIRYVPTFLSAQRTSTKVGRALIGIETAMQTVAWRYDVEVVALNERTVRKQVLGVCDFGLIDPRTGGVIADSGREEAKRIVLEWCAKEDHVVMSHDVGDALVLLAYDPLLKPKRGLAVKRRVHPDHSSPFD